MKIKIVVIILMNLCCAYHYAGEIEGILSHRLEQPVSQLSAASSQGAQFAQSKLRQGKLLTVLDRQNFLESHVNQFHDPTLVENLRKGIIAMNSADRQKFISELRMRINDLTRNYDKTLEYKNRALSRTIKTYSYSPERIDQSVNKILNDLDTTAHEIYLLKTQLAWAETLEKGAQKEPFETVFVHGEEIEVQQLVAHQARALKLKSIKMIDGAQSQMKKNEKKIQSLENKISAIESRLARTGKVEVQFMEKGAQFEGIRKSLNKERNDLIHQLGMIKDENRDLATFMQLTQAAQKEIDAFLGIGKRDLTQPLFRLRLILAELEKYIARLKLKMRGMSKSDARNLNNEVIKPTEEFTTSIPRQ